jgi:protease-4
MKQFLTYTLATMVGLLLAGLISFLLLAAIVGALSSTDQSYSLEKNSVLILELDGEIVEQGQDGMFNLETLGLPFDAGMNQQGLDDLLLAIKKAAESEEIKGIYLKAGSMDAGFATAEVLRKALIEFKRTGKFIVSYADNYDQREYYICSVADNMLLNPIGMVNWSGLSATPVFFTKTLEKLGVEMQVFKVGTFKSAVEPYIKTEMSPESRLQTEEYLNGIWNQVMTGVAASRNLTVEALNRLADENQLMKPADELVTNRMVDSLVYETGAKDYLAKLNGVDKAKDLSIVTVSNLLLAPNKNSQYKKEKIAVLYAEGEIFDEGQEGITAKALVKEMEDIRDNDNIKAVVFRINSPGGSAFASEQIWQALTSLKDKKPVVVSMGNYAASGGYYIACNATKIVASPTTLTGSIGIFAVFPTFDKLTKKIGLSFDVVKTNNLGDLGNLTRPMNTLEKQKIQRYIENGYDLFVKRCADGRKMKPEALRNIAEGRVWTGQKAVELGLVDTLGTINDAIEMAATLSKCNEYQLSYYPEKKDYMTVLLDALTQQTKLKLAISLLGKEYEPFVALRTSRIQTGVLAKTDVVEIR